MAMGQERKATHPRCCPHGFCRPRRIRGTGGPLDNGLCGGGGPRAMRCPWARVQCSFGTPRAAPAAGLRCNMSPQISTNLQTATVGIGRAGFWAGRRTCVDHSKPLLAQLHFQQLRSRWCGLEDGGAGEDAPVGLDRPCHKSDAWLCAGTQRACAVWGITFERAGYYFLKNSITILIL